MTTGRINQVTIIEPPSRNRALDEESSLKGRGVTGPNLIVTHPAARHPRTESWLSANSHPFAATEFPSATSAKGRPNLIESSFGMATAGGGYPSPVTSS